jgi:hypothetical protein
MRAKKTPDAGQGIEGRESNHHQEVGTMTTVANPTKATPCSGLTPKM